MVCVAGRGLSSGHEEMSPARQTLSSSADLPSLRSGRIVFADLGFASLVGWFLTRSSGEVVPGRRGVGAVLRRLCFAGGCPSLSSSPGPSPVLPRSHMEKITGEAPAFLMLYIFPFA